MLKYPKSVPTQQAVLAPLNAVVNQVPGCELYIAFAASVDRVYDQLSVGALQNIAMIARNASKVFDYLHDQSMQSVYSSQYLLRLSQSAKQLSVNASLAAMVATGSSTINVTSGAQMALTTLDAWDSTLGYNAPSSPGQLVTTVLQGVTVP